MMEGSRPSLAIFCFSCSIGMCILFSLKYFLYAGSTAHFFTGAEAEEESSSQFGSSCSMMEGSRPSLAIFCFSCSIGICILFSLKYFLYAGSIEHFFTGAEGAGVEGAEAEAEEESSSQFGSSCSITEGSKPSLAIFCFNCSIGICILFSLKYFLYAGSTAHFTGFTGAAGGAIAGGGGTALEGPRGDDPAPPRGGGGGGAPNRFGGAGGAAFAARSYC